MGAVGDKFSFSDQISELLLVRTPEDCALWRDGIRSYVIRHTGAPSNDGAWALFNVPLRLNDLSGKSSDKRTGEI